MKKIILTILIGFTMLAQPHARPLMPEGVSKKRLATEFLWRRIRELPVGERPRVVVVLGGGGARGLAHIGALRVFEQEQIPIDEIVGISVGALIGALYAGGVSLDQLETMAQEVGWDKLTDMTTAGIVKMILQEELLSTERMETYLEARLGKKYFKDLAIPFRCIATDIRTGERVVFQEGPVAVAARASATIPGIFRPVEYRHRLLVDGGLTDVLPTDLASPKDWAVVIGIIPTADMEDFEVSSIFKSLIRSLEIQKDVMVEEKKKMADYIIEPYLGAMSMIDLSKNMDAIRAGTRATRRNAVEMKRLIIQHVLERNEPRIGER